MSRQTFLHCYLVFKFLSEFYYQIYFLRFFVDNQTFKLDNEGVIWISDCCPLVVI